jgi:hypothetical protein
MKVFLYQNRNGGGPDDEAIYIGLYFVESTDERGYVNGTLLDLYSHDDFQRGCRVGKGTGNMVEMWFLANHAALVYDDQELATLSDVVL